MVDKPDGWFLIRATQEWMRQRQGAGFIEYPASTVPLGGMVIVLIE